MYAEIIKKITQHLVKLPGVGHKTAEKYIFEILSWDQASIEAFAHDIVSLKEQLTQCSICHNYSQDPICIICTDSRRQQNIICVVASYQDFLSIEEMGEYKGVYHILNGTLNPLEGVTPDTLTIGSLFSRIEKNNIEEIILALNPDIPGESTTLYLTQELKKIPDIQISRIARGLPMGASLEYADQTTLSNALKGRTRLT